MSGAPRARGMRGGQDGGRGWVGGSLETMVHGVDFIIWKDTGGVLSSRMT